MVSRGTEHLLPVDAVACSLLLGAVDPGCTGLLLLLLLLLLCRFPCSLQVGPPFVGRPAIPRCASCWGAAVEGYVLPPPPLLQREFYTLARRHTLSV